MKVKYIKRVFFSALLLFCMSVTTVYATVTQEDINQVQNQVNNLQQQKENAENVLDDINNKKDALENNLSDLGSELDTLVSDMNDLEDQIDVKQDEIAIAATDLETAEAQVQKQYGDLKIRIQYMYENGTSSLLDAFFESKSIAELINQTENVSAMIEYDREKLAEYQQLQAELKEKKAQLEKEESSLLALQDEMGQKRTQVNQLISNTQQNLSQANTEASYAQATVDDLAAQLAYWEAYEAQLEAQKLAQDLALWEQIQQEGKEDLSGITYVPAEGELYLLAAIIQCESEGEPYAGKLAVGSVVMNRVKSSKFPNTITEVIYQKKQFSPVASGRLSYRLSVGVNDTCMQAAVEVLNGTITTDALFFRRVTPGINGTVIGNHVFY